MSAGIAQFLVTVLVILMIVAAVLVIALGVAFLIDTWPSRARREAERRRYVALSREIDRPTGRDTDE